MTGLTPILPPDAQHPILRIGAVGLGRAFTLMAPTFVKHPSARLVAAADPRPEARDAFNRDFGGRTYTTVDELCADPDVDLVYIATPHHMHAAQAEAAAQRGKHILVEKPMALTLADCKRMVRAAEEAHVLLAVGHSHSYDAPIARARQLIASRVYGELRMISAIDYTDFLYRPRRPDELDTATGGGVIFNQAPHQVDILRLLGGGRLKSVRAGVGRWDAKRPTEGAYTAFFEFESGVFASLTYSGYAHYDSDALCEWRSEQGEMKDPNAYGAARRALSEIMDTRNEQRLKADRLYGGPRFAAPSQAPTTHPHFGFLIASCESADLRPTPLGVEIHADSERFLDLCPVPSIPRREVVDELCGALFGSRPLVHDGAWGLATMEACLAILASSREGREILLSEQSGLRDD